MIQHFQSLFGHCAWANRLTLESLLACPAAQTEGTPLLAHLLAAEQIWLSRLQRREPVLSTWPSLSLHDCQALMADCERGWREYLWGLPEQELRGEIEYRTSRGDLFHNTIAEVLMQVVTHGGYHRGQIAKIVSREGGTAASTDYILYVRSFKSAEALPPSARSDHS